MKRHKPAKRKPGKRAKPVRAIHGRITQLREARSISQSEFAAKLGLDKSLIGHWEHGRSAPGPRNILKVADFFGVTVDELMREAA